MSMPALLAIEPNLSAIARVCKVTPQAVAQWKVSGQVPRHHVIALCRAYNVRPHTLRPDLYEPEWTVRRLKKGAKS